MMKDHVFFYGLLFLLSFQLVCAQNEYKPFGILYRSANFTIELQYRINDPCGTGSKLSRYRYYVTGTPRANFSCISWKIDYYNCSNSITEQTVNIDMNNLYEGINENIDYSFPGKNLLVPFYNVRTGHTPDNSKSFTKVLPKSEAAKLIEGDQKIGYGDETKLTVSGGALGVNAQWQWYINDCGTNKIGEGQSIVVSPKETQRYFVRAESQKDTTACVSVMVQVDPFSKAPESIGGKQVVCVNQQTTLTVEGGKLGKEAEWVWYQDNINGKAVAKGASITISPTKNTVYLVRAESPTNTTAYASASINVAEEKLSDPLRIAGAGLLCQGSSVSLEVQGGELSSYAQWYWYQDAVAPGNLIGKGRNLTVAASRSATYYVRGEGVCTHTQTVSLPVRVYSLSTKPSSVTVTSAGSSDSKRIRLYVAGGSLGENAKWTWYKSDCTNGSKMGEGQSITVKRRKNATYYVRAESPCNVTACASRTTYKPAQEAFTFFNFGVTTSFSPNQSGDAMESVRNGLNKISNNPIATFTFGKLKKTGWYLRGKYSFAKESALYECDKTQITNYNSSGNYYVFNKQAREKRLGITGGLVWRITKVFYLQTGGGYGKRELLWGLNEYAKQTNIMVSNRQWAKNKGASFEGLELEATILMKISFLNLSFGTSALPTSDFKSFKYIDAHAGIGFNL